MKKSVRSGIVCIFCILLPAVCFACDRANKEGESDKKAGSITEGKLLISGTVTRVRRYCRKKGTRPGEKEKAWIRQQKPDTTYAPGVNVFAFYKKRSTTDTEGTRYGLAATAVADTGSRYKLSLPPGTYCLIADRDRAELIQNNPKARLKGVLDPDCIIRSFCQWVEVTTESLEMDLVSDATDLYCHRCYRGPKIP